MGWQLSSTTTGASLLEQQECQCRCIWQTCIILEGAELTYDCYNMLKEPFLEF